MCKLGAIFKFLSDENDIPGTVVISSQVAPRREDAKDLRDPVTIDFVVLVSS